MVGLTAIRQRRWRGLVRCLQAYAQGAGITYTNMPADIQESSFISLAADDLKAFYMEARMCQWPDQKHNDQQNWFWTETAVGELLAKIAAAWAPPGTMCSPVPLSALHVENIHSDPRRPPDSGLDCPYGRWRLSGGNEEHSTQRGYGAKGQECQIVLAG